MKADKKQSTHISVNNLVFSYPPRKPLLRNLKLEIMPGEKVGIIGPNGSGKTTLFLLLAGILTPDSGSLSILDSPVKKRCFNRNLGFVFQNPDDQLFCPTVKDDLSFGLYNLGYTKEEADIRVENYLCDTKMSELSERPPHNLSGGEKRMISIGGVMIMKPSVVILDEPESSLDCRSRRKLIEFLKQSEETLLIASHDFEFLLETCERVVILDNGQICSDGKSQTIMGDQVLMESHGFEKPHSLVPHAIKHHDIS